MPQFADRVKTTSTSTGSSAITLSSSGATGYQAFPSSLDGETVGYVIEASGGTDWEIGTGVYTHSTLGLSRTLRSSSTGSLLNLGSGTHTVFLTPAAQDIQIVEAFSGTSDLPSASASHGRIYHVHGEAAMYFAHSGSWVKLANYSDITTYTHPNHSGEVTSTGDGATVIADNVVDEANLKVSNSPTDGYVLTARSGNTGGMTWEAVSGGGGSSTSALTETTFAASANQTAFVVSGGITNAANVSVFQNGVKLEEGSSKDYTVNASTNTVTLNSGATAGDVVEVLEYGQPASSGSGVTVYTGLSGTDGTPSGATYLLNASSPSAGDLAYVTANTSLYQNNGNGWYRIAVINTTPTISSVADASSNTTPFTLTAGTNTVITVTASDVDEGTDLTYSHSVTSGSLNGTTVTQGTGASENVFTITPHASNATTFSITFTVSDSINAATSVAAFTLAFGWTSPSQQARLISSDAAFYDKFGQSVSLSDDGNTALVGAGFAATSDSGAAYIFTRSGSTWSQEAKILSSDIQGDDFFGYSVSISGDGDTALVGAFGEDTGSTNSGSAYIFTRSGSTWSQEAKIRASDAAQHDQFGYSVSISDDGNTAIVGAYKDDHVGGDAGSAYVFTRSGTTWSQQAKLVASDAAASQYFGYSVSISDNGNTAIAGAYLANKAYVFTRSGTTWSQQASLTSDDAAYQDYFGYSVSISGDGDTALVGAYKEDATATNAGSAYIFTRSGSTWSQEAKIQSSDAEADDEFGYFVSISDNGNTALIGAHFEDTTATNAGSAYIFARSGTTWSQEAKIQADNAAASDQFGVSVSISGDASTVLVGALYGDDTSTSDTGAAYVFVK